MSLFADLLGKVLPLVGAGTEFAQKADLRKKLLKQLGKKQPNLEIPQAYQNLLASLSGQVDKLGTAQHMQTNLDFQNQLARALSNLKQRGVASSNLTANLMAGSQQKQTLANASIDENLLAQKIGLQSGIGLQGLGTSAAERGQLRGIQGSMYAQLTNPILGASPFADLLKGLASLGTKAAVAPV